MILTQFLTASALLLGLVTGQEDNATTESNEYSSINRGMQDMGIRWRIEDAIFDFDKDENIFKLAWEISDSMQDVQFGYKIFDNVECNTENGGQDITLSSNDVNGNHFYLYTAGLHAHMNTPYNAASDGTGSRTTFLHLAMQTQQLPHMSIWDNDLNQMNFCVRYSLYTEDGAIEVNFQEVLIQLDVDMTDGFSVTGISVAPLDRTANNANAQCVVEGYICDQSNDVLTDQNLLNQGDEIRICVRTTQETRDSGLWLEKINWFYFIRDDVLPSVTQEAIDAGGLQDEVGLTYYNCQPGEDPCGFDNILRADFYKVPGVGQVRGIGEAICQLGRETYSDPPSVTPEGCTAESSGQILLTKDDPDEPMPSDCVTIVSQNTNSVEFSISQKWKSPDSVSWIQPVYNQAAGTLYCNEADKEEEVGPNIAHSYTALCNGGKASIEIFAHDGQFPGSQSNIRNCNGWGNDSGIAYYKMELSCTGDDICADISSAPSAAPSISSTDAPTIAWDEWIPVTDDFDGGCITDPMIVWTTYTPYMGILEDAFSITHLNDANTAVDIHITQNFADSFSNGPNGDSTLDWLAVYYPSVPEGAPNCARTGENGVDHDGGNLGDILTVSALCHNAFADPVQLYVHLNVYVFDEQLNTDFTGFLPLPDQCNPTPDEGGNVAFTLFVPCGECPTRRHLEHAMIRNGMMEKEDTVQFKKTGKYLHSIVQKGQRRYLEEEEQGPTASPQFDLDISIDGSGDAFQASAATMASSLVMTLLLVATTAWTMIMA